MTKSTTIIMVTTASLEDFRLASSKYKIPDLNAHQRLAVRKIVVERDEIFVNIPFVNLSMPWSCLN